MRIVTDKPVQLQAKSTKPETLIDAKIVYIGAKKVLVGLSPTGELVIVDDPP